MRLRRRYRAGNFGRLFLCNYSCAANEKSLYHECYEVNLIFVYSHGCDMDHVKHVSILSY